MAAAGPVDMWTVRTIDEHRGASGSLFDQGCEGRCRVADGSDVSGWGLDVDQSFEIGDQQVQSVHAPTVPARHNGEMRHSWVTAAACCSLIATACSGPGEASRTTTTDTATTTNAPVTTAHAATGTQHDSTSTTSTTTTTTIAPPPPFIVSPGTEQVTITAAEPDLTLALFDATGAELARGTTDATGALLFRRLPGGATLTVTDGTYVSEPVTTMDRNVHPAPAFYAEQRLPDKGLGYITTRDGTTLSASVWLPGPAEDGPYPTVVEYSGYSPSDPDATGFPDIFVALGYAYVGVNIRGTGCSGGSFRYFEYAQSLDGYDAIETVAAQPWVLDHAVGMVGVSYSGIAQLFVAQTQPPSLIAITPFSVLDDSYQATLYPGGILNTGFAVKWAEQRASDSRPNGQAWAVARIADGDDVCEANQGLRLQNPDPLAEIRANPFWSDDPGAAIAPRLFVDKITVPTLIAGAWQDEQTGGHFPTILDKFTGTDHLYATMTNGLHTESIGPAVMPRYVEFLDLYVAKRTPTLAAARAVATQLSQAIFATSEIALPGADRFAGMSPDQALAAFEAEPPIRVLFEEGAADGFPARAPMPRWQAEFAAWPVPTAKATTWNLGADGALTIEQPQTGGETSYLALPDAIPATFYEGDADGIWDVDVQYDWQDGGAGTFAAFRTAPLANDTVVVGSGSVDLWITSNLGDTDLEVTITEIRPDGQEMYVQSGWLRASQRALDERASTRSRPVHTHTEADARPLRNGTPELVRVELFPFAHAFRAGSRIRLIVDAPGGNRGVWEFETIAGGEQVTISETDLAPSHLVLPIVAGVFVPPDYPECGALRGQPCRRYTGP